MVTGNENVKIVFRAHVRQQWNRFTSHQTEMIGPIYFTSENVKIFDTSLFF